MIRHPIYNILTNNDIQKILSVVRTMSEDNNEAAAALIKAAAGSVALDLIKTDDRDFTVQKKKTQSRTIRFSPREVDKMPKTFRKEFRVNGCSAHVYKMPSGKHSYCYLIRYRKNGYYIVASSTDLEEAKRKFIQKLNEADRNGGTTATYVPDKFEDFANYFFENFYKRKVVAVTYRVALNQFKNHLLPYFANMPLKKITPRLCQTLIDNTNADGKGRTVDGIFSLLNMIFKTAVKHGLITNNPMDMVFHQKHEREHGKALTKDEERKLLEETAGTPYRLMFAIALYTGLRPNEYKTAHIEGNFIVANNSKRKNGKTELKKIPITPMLKPYVENITEFHFTRLEQIRNKFNKVLPGHKLYDLRTTFYTRCQECNVSPAARDEFVGHSLGALGNTYTDLSDEFLLAEGQKLNYTYGANASPNFSVSVEASVAQSSRK